MLLLALLLALESSSVASPPVNPTQSLVLYRDCSPEQTPSIPIFAEWEDESNHKVNESEVPSQYYTNGISISVVQDPSGKLTGVQIGDQISVPISGLRPGISFGALNSVIHTLEVDAGFDLNSGGIIRFGFSKNFEVSDMLNDLSKPINRHATLGPVSSVSAYQKELKGSNWGEKKYLLAKQDGQWVLLDLKSRQQVHAIYAVMKTGPLFKLTETQQSNLKMITGLTTMVDEYVSGDPLQCTAQEGTERISKDKGHKIPFMRSVITDRELKKSFECVSE